MRRLPGAEPSKIKHWVSDEDEARRQARERLDDARCTLGGEGVAGKGRHRRRGPDSGHGGRTPPLPGREAIISTHPPGRSNWLERDVVERARERFALPVSHVVVDLEHERDAVAQQP